MRCSMSAVCSLLTPSWWMKMTLAFMWVIAYLKNGCCDLLTKAQRNNWGIKEIKPDLKSKLYENYIKCLKGTFRIISFASLGHRWIIGRWMNITLRIEYISP